MARKVARPMAASWPQANRMRLHVASIERSGWFKSWVTSAWELRRQTCGSAGRGSGPWRGGPRDADGGPGEATSGGGV